MCKTDGEPIASNWSGSAFSRLTDNQVMTQLMAAAELELDTGEQMRAGKYLCSFAIMRPFRSWLLPALSFCARRRLGEVLRVVEGWRCEETA